ncbi:dTDP-4-dehydrorhamnose reductase [Lachnoclostridium phytofermentans]|uniref:dTDP-4-dehydrorhamnose reductase n=1 Tax=Lachnoclostridium phytofermentans (strain ATCC 700394 / DSM 18823 / ISDg) TaxID=357809 RepID=A9KJK6_LACP7|nr:dTDP-4-dehydrorhamnose reductase [Lachnoclostridium phytofermentans]ABX44026.1 dTDP-4-dehydrorhamnose reductase [Lachnoclostridium phytofermentans ISDg]
MRVVVTGVNGQLGYDVVKELEKHGLTAFGLTRKDLDITDKDQVIRTIRDINPEAVINCAAYTAVDLAEEEKEETLSANALAASYLAIACAGIHAKMIYLSTDYVFSGEGEKPYEVCDQVAPINWYGQTKYEGEQAVIRELDSCFIVRVSWVFGKNGKNFVKTMLRLSEERNTVSVVADQIGSPTYTVDLAKCLVAMIKTDKYGIYHVTNEGFCSWYDFAKEIFRMSGKNTTVQPLTSDEFPTKAKRPKNSRLSKEKLTEQGFERLPTWQDALSRYLYELQAENLE